MCGKGKSYVEYYFQDLFVYCKHVAADYYNTELCVKSLILNNSN